MKNKFKNRKALEDIARQLNMLDKVHHVTISDNVTKDQSLRLVNNGRRFVKGMLKLSIPEQDAKIKLFYEKMPELIKANNDFRAELQDEIKDVTINNPLSEMAKEFIATSEKE